MDFLTQKCCDRTSKRIRLELHDKRSEIHLHVFNFWLNEILVQVTLLSETDFGFQSKHIHLMKFCESVCLCVNIENLGILDAAEKESG